MFLLLGLILFLLPVSVYSGPFYGGSMSFKVLQRHPNLTVEVLLLTGWKLGQGPCGPGCDESKIGMDTAISTAYNPQRFGYLGTETHCSDGTAMNVVQSKDMNRTGKVQMVSELARWEMEGAKIILTVESCGSDIIFQGDGWASLNMMPNVTQWHMQVTVSPDIRSDTGRPNSSPIVLMKPFYRLQWNKRYTIHIPVIDEDDDIVLCRTARHIEAGSQLHEAYKHISIFTVTKDCNIEFAPSLTHPNATGAVAVTVKDYNRRGIKLGNELIPPHHGEIGSITVQFYFEVLGNADAPEFISPTPPSKTRYTIYIGVDFSVQVYVKANGNNRMITKLYFLRRDAETVNVSSLTSSPSLGPSVKTGTAQWIPTEAEIGFHILCGNAEDNVGFGCVDMRCFIIDVRAPIINRSSSSSVAQGQLHFIHFPDAGDIKCKINSYCKFPVFAISNQPGGVLKFEDVSGQSVYNITIIDGDSPQTVSYNSQHVQRAKVEFYATVAGLKSICIKASDKNSSISKCLDAKVENIDPCSSMPCLNSGSCIANADLSHYKCVCDYRATGQHCEQYIDFCQQPNYCKNGAQCQKINPTVFLCLCPPKFTGPQCNHEIDVCSSFPCGHGGICEQVGSAAKCHCRPGLSGAHCDVSASSSGHPNGPTCTGDQILVPTLSSPCVCGVAFSTCNNEKNIYQNNLKTLFVPPTLDDRSTISCNTYGDQKCTVPVYVLCSEIPVVTSMTDQIELSIDIGKPFRTKIGTSANVYMIPIKLSRDSRSMVMEYDICFAASKKSSASIKEDSKCFHIQYSNKEINGNKTISDFDIPTPGPGTTIACESTTLCHLFVYTKTNNTQQCKDVKLSSDYPMGASKAVLVKDAAQTQKCETNVVIDVTHLHTDTVCIKSWEEGESRCFKIKKLQNISSPCSSQPCKNGGTCQNTVNGSFSCHCADQYKGTKCEKGICPTSSTTCTNSSYCYTDGNVESCICRQGFVGDHCARNSSESLTNPVNGGGQFISAALPDTVKCLKDIPCKIPLSVTGNSQSAELHTGFVDNHITVQSISKLQSQPSSQTHTSMVEVIGKAVGTHKICVHTNGNNGQTGDDVCVQVQVKSGNENPVSTMQPYFLEPTLPDQSEVECIVNEQCHMTLWASDRDGCSDCPTVTSSEISEEKVHIFQTTDVSSNCPSDVVLQSDIVQQKQICFTITSPTILLQGRDGEKRCFQVHFRMQSTVKTPCSHSNCQNGGLCDGRTGVAVCTCLSGYSGSTCNEHRGASQTIPIPPNKNNIFGDIAIPNEIHCYLKQPCPLPVSMLSTTSPKLQIGGHDDELQITLPNMNMDPNHQNNNHHGNADIYASAAGTFKACIHGLDSSSEVTDEVCFKVAVTDPGNNAQNPDQQLPHFESPTIPANSSVNCRPEQTCHVLLKMSPGNYVTCPDVHLKDAGSPFLHIAHSTSNSFVKGSCNADVMITPPNSESGQKRTYCFQASLPSVPGETRCFEVNYASVSPTQCLGKTCRNGGYCDSLQTLGKCVCPPQTTGDQCDKLQINNGNIQSSQTSQTNGTNQGGQSNGTISANQAGQINQGGHIQAAQGGQTNQGGRIPVTQGGQLNQGGHIPATQSGQTNQGGHSNGNIPLNPGGQTNPGGHSNGNIPLNPGGQTIQGGHSNGNIPLNPGGQTNPGIHSNGNIPLNPGGQTNQGGNIPLNPGGQGNHGCHSNGNIPLNPGGQTNQGGNIPATQGGQTNQGGNIPVNPGGQTNQGGNIPATQGGQTNQGGNIPATQGGQTNQGGNIPLNPGGQTNQGGNIPVNPGGQTNQGGNIPANPVGQTNQGGNIPLNPGGQTNQGGNIPVNPGGQTNQGGNIPANPGGQTNQGGNIPTTQGGQTNQGGNIPANPGGQTNQGGNIPLNPGGQTNQGGNILVNPGGQTNQGGNIPATQGGQTNQGGNIPATQGGQTNQGGNIPLNPGGQTNQGGNIPVNPGGQTNQGGNIPATQGGQTNQGGNLPVNQGGQTNQGGNIPLNQGGQTNQGGNIPANLGGQINQGGHSNGYIPLNPGGQINQGGQSNVPTNQAGVCTSITSNAARGHAQNGRVECVCRNPTTSKTAVVIQGNTKVPMQNILRAAGLGAVGSMGTISITLLLYVLVGKFKNKMEKLGNTGRVQPQRKPSG